MAEEEVVVPETVAATTETQTDWAPDFKYSVMGQDREIDPVLRSSITNAESQKKVIDFATRADAFDHYRNKYGEIETKYKDIESKYSNREAQLSKLGDYWSKKDYDGFFRHLGVPEDVLLQHAVNRIKFRDLPEEQKKLYNDNQSRAERESQLEQQLNDANTRAESEGVLARTFQLDNELEKGEVKQVSESYDALYGKGSFRNEIIKLGQYEALMNKRDLPASEAVAAIMGKAKPIVDRLGNQVTQSQAAKPTVIPNVKGNPSAPGKKGFNSIADLKAAAAKFGD